MRLRLATFNIRNVNDRYGERRNLLARAFADINPDIAGLQEVMFREPRQDDFLARQALGRNYWSFDTRFGRHPDFGNAILVGAGEPLAFDELRLSHHRAAHRVLVALPNQVTLWIANTHLHHRPQDHDIRLEQTQSLCEWMAAAPAADAAIVAGDFNSAPGSPAYNCMRATGWRSAFLETNGREPDVTWPSGIQAETMDTDGDPACLDYIWVKGKSKVLSASVAANQPAPGDPTLYPSDHFALVAEIEV